MNKTLLILAAVTVSRCSPCPSGVVADTLFAECRGESKVGQKAVASVIWNRAKGNPARLEAVCLKPKQFSCWNNGYRKAAAKNAKEKAILSEFDAMESQMMGGTFKPSGAWTHYHTIKVNPSWSKTMTGTKVIGNHKFGVTK